MSAPIKWVSGHNHEQLQWTGTTAEDSVVYDFRSSTGTGGGVTAIIQPEALLIQVTEATGAWALTDILATPQGLVFADGARVLE